MKHTSVVIICYGLPIPVTSRGELGDRLRKSASEATSQHVNPRDVFVFLSSANVPGNHYHVFIEGLLIGEESGEVRDQLKENIKGIVFSFLRKLNILGAQIRVLIRQFNPETDSFCDAVT